MGDGEGRWRTNVGRRNGPRQRRRRGKRRVFNAGKQTCRQLRVVACIVRLAVSSIRSFWQAHLASGHRHRRRLSAVVQSSGRCVSVTSRRRPNGQRLPVSRKQPREWPSDAAVSAVPDSRRQGRDALSTEYHEPIEVSSERQRVVQRMSARSRPTNGCASLDGYCIHEWQDEIAFNTTQMETKSRMPCE